MFVAAVCWFSYLHTNTKYITLADVSIFLCCYSEGTQGQCSEYRAATFRLKGHVLNNNCHWLTKQLWDIVTLNVLVFTFVLIG